MYGSEETEFTPNLSCVWQTKKKAVSPYLTLFELHQNFQQGSEHFFLNEIS